MPAPQSLPSRLIGALFVERGLVSESQIRVALEIQRETGQQLGQVLVERFGVSRKELASVVADQWAKLGGSAGPEDNASWRRLGDIFVDRGFVTQEELDEALARQRQTGERLGEALVAQGVISKFELAGALAEQMAELGDPGTETRAETAQAGATVHQLHTRDDAEPAAPTANVIDLVPPTEWGAGSVLSNGAPVAEEHVAEEPVAEQKSEFDAISSHTEPVEEARPAEEMLTELHEALAAEERVAADEPVAAELSTEQEALETVEPHAEGEPVETVDAHVGPVEEPWPAEVMSTEPDAVVDEEPVAAELSAEREALETVEAYAEPVEEPWAAEVMRTEAHDTPAVEVGYVDEAAHDGDPLAACVAFAPTTEGYRLVALEAQPAAGETIDIPDVGEYLVLRVGSSPIPGDERRCAYVEERVAPALIAAVAH